MQRSSVDLPDPDAPIRQTTSCSSTARSMPFSTSRSPKDLCRPSMRSASVIGRARPFAGAGASDVPVNEPRHRDREQQEDQRAGD